MDIGDTIRDIEDGDCFVEGVIVSLNPLMYIINREIWNSEESLIEKGCITEQRWWKIELIKKG